MTAKNNSNNNNNSNKATNVRLESQMKKVITNGISTNKPLMEKRRRARINYSLSNLKTLILDTTSKHSKLEKADILELAVRYFQRHRNLEIPSLNKYQAGYFDCISEVHRFLNSPNPIVTNLNTDIKKCLLLHLDQCAHEINNRQKVDEDNDNKNGEQQQQNVWRPWESEPKVSNA